MNEEQMPKKKEAKQVEKQEHEPKKKKHGSHEKKLLEQNEILVKQNQELNEKILRLSAETQNMRRHFEEDRMKLMKYDGEALIMELLPVIDNFERAILLDDANLTDDVSKFLSGFKMIYASFKDTLNKMGIKEIECLGKPFDSMTMNAVLIDHEKDVEDNVVLDCMQKGYIYKDRIIRPAMVKVNNKESEE